jgi:hypothetical protein
MRKSSLYYYEGTRPKALLEAFADAAQNFPVVVPQGYARKKKGSSSGVRTLNVLLSDLHFGTDLLPDEHLLAYSNKEEARRLAKVLVNVLDYKTDKRDETTLQVLLNGDLLAGLLGHDDRANAELTVQMMRAAHLLTQFLAHCCAHFRRVVVRVQYGNHGRNLLRHMSRQDNRKFENFELLTVMMVTGPLRGMENLTWDIPKRPISFWKTFSHQFGMTHGDTVLGKKPGTEALEAAVAKVKASRFYRLKGELDVLFLGHWHQGTMQVMGDTTVIVNPPLLPPDGHSESSGYLNACGQWLLESTVKHPVGDVRLVRVDEDDDQNSSFDALISPWTEALTFVHVEET